MWLNEGMVIVELISVLLLVLVLVFAARVLMDSFKKLMLTAGWEARELSYVLVALLLMLPEFAVGVAAAVDGKGEVFLGNLVGVNLVTVAVVVAGMAIMTGSVTLVGELSRWEGGMVMLSGVIPMLLMSDGELQGVDGLVLVLLYVAYILRVMALGRHRQFASGGRIVLTWAKSVMGRGKQKPFQLMAIMVLSWLVMLVVAYLLVRQGMKFGELVGIGSWLVGVLVIGAMVGVVELFLGYLGRGKKHSVLVFHDVIGGLIANMTLVLGICVLIFPLEKISVSRMSFAVAMYLFIFGLFWLFGSVKKRLSRWEGMVLLGCYVMFVGWMLLMR